jgi:N utilization substance protein A
LNPSQVLYVSLNEGENNATVVVQDKQLSLAIGREGQNARLAAKLTGWKIDILSSADVELERLRKPAPAPAVAKPVSEAQAPAEPVEVLEKVEVEPVEATDAAVPVAEVEPVEAEMEELVAEEQPVVIEVEEEAPAAVEDDWSDFTIEEEEVEEVEEVEEIPLTDDIWQVPQLTPTGGGSQIRFAEDLIVPRGGEGRRGRGGRRGKRRKGAAT